MTPKERNILSQLALAISEVHEAGITPHYHDGEFRVTTGNGSSFVVDMDASTVRIVTDGHTGG
jgi:hypothetical protein